MRIRWVGQRAAMLAIALRSGAIAAALIGAGLLASVGVDLGRRMLGPDGDAAQPAQQRAIAALQAELADLQLERARLVAALDISAADTQSRDRQTIQIKALEVENGKLADDLVDFARQLPARGVLAIHRAEAELLETGLHYRLLLTQAAQGAPGRQLELMVTGEQGGQLVQLAFPAAGAGSGPLDDYTIKSGQLQRFEGTLTLPDGVAVKTISARVLEKGQVLIQQSVTLRGANHVRS